MRSWIPVPGTTSGRLAVAALDLFGSRGYASVAVVDIAGRAGVTTGSLYHHFGSKAGLYHLVRADVEQRVVDRLEGAASARPVTSVPGLAPVLLVGFDYLVASGFARLLGETDPEPADRPDPVAEIVGRLLAGKDAPVGAMVAAAWRQALNHAGAGADEAAEARTALHLLLAGG